jgi:putative transposase
MPREPRIVRPGLPHHVTQRGNRRQKVFFSDGDYTLYCQLLADECRKYGVQVWAYCLMPNHVHLLLVPQSAEALTPAVSETHRRYTTAVNRRQGWTGHLWQGRYGSEPIGNDAALFTVVRYIEQNPAGAGLVARPELWPWSSANSHLTGAADAVLDDAQLRAMVPNWRAFLAEGT